MVTSRPGNETANAEVLGVVILIAIFAITAGIISATTFASPQPVKVPAASIEITQPSQTSVHFAHRGGDPLPLAHLVVRWIKADGTSGSTEGTDELRALFQLASDDIVLGNGLSREILEDWDAVALNWRSDGGEATIAVWDPQSLGLAGSGAPFTPGAPWKPRTQPALTPLPVPSVEALSAEFVVPSSLTVGQSFTFTSTEARATSFLWNFGDGTTSTLMTETHVFPRVGIYSVSLTVSNADTSDTVVHTISVGPGSPDEPLRFEVSPTLGIGPLEVTCTDTTHIGQTLWQWRFTDGLTGRVLEQTPRLTEGVGRSYHYVFNNPSVVSDNVCTVDLTVWSPYAADPIAFETQTVTVAPPLRADFISDVTVGISPQSVQFTDTSIGHPQTWAWDFGDGSTSTEQNPVHTYTVTDPNLPQTFTVTLTVTGWGQTSSLSKDIVIWPPVVADFTADKTEGEAGLIVQFTDLSTGQVSKWHWDFGDGTSSDERNPQHTFMNPGKYDVTLFVEREAEPHSVDPKTLPIYIRVGPEVMTDFTATPTTVATGVEVQFTDLSTSADPVVSWSWDFGDGSILEGTDPAVHKNPRHAYTAADTYTVTLTAENQYRKKTMTKVGYITVYPAVVASFTADHTAAPIGGLISFTDTSTESPTSWSWDFGDGTIEVIQNPSHTYTAAGVYSVTLTASNAYSTSPPKTRIDYITVFEPVTAAFTADPLEGSTPLTVTFTDGSTGDVDTWSWDFNGDNVADSDLEAPSYTFSAAGDHVVTLTAWNKLRPDLTSTASATIKVDSLPTASFTTSTSSGSRPLSVTFTDTSSGNPVSWSWDFDGNGTVDDTTRSPTHTYATADTYTVRLTVSNQAGGSSPATTTIVVT